MELSRNIKRAADRYEPIETAGLTLWPIRVCEQEEFEMARPAIDVIQQALPVRYAVMPLLTAYWVMDLESMERGEEPVGLFNRALAFLALALLHNTPRLLLLYPMRPKTGLCRGKLAAPHEKILENQKNRDRITITILLQKEC